MDPFATSVHRSGQLSAIHDELMELRQRLDMMEHRWRWIMPTIACLSSFLGSLLSGLLT